MRVSKGTKASRAASSNLLAAALAPRSLSIRSDSIKSGGGGMLSTSAVGVIGSLWNATPTTRAANALATESANSAAGSRSGATDRLTTISLIMTRSSKRKFHWNGALSLEEDQWRPGSFEGQRLAAIARAERAG